MSPAVVGENAEVDTSVGLVIVPEPRQEFVAPARTPWSVARGLVRGTRPKQWVKQVLVLAAPAAAGVLFHPHALALTALAVVAFTLAAGGTYLINDASDVAADRQHPTKRFRPLASGEVPLPLGWAVGIALMVGSVALGFVANWQLAAVLAVYVTMTLTYSRRLKHVAIVEMIVVALGFVLRALAGATAVDVDLSQWFVIVASFGALFMVAGKRHAEAVNLADGGKASRKVLHAYPVSFLKLVRDSCLAVTVLAYCLFAFQRGQEVHLALAWYQLSILPVTLGLLRYALLLERGEGGAPEELVLSDRTLQLAGLGWVVLFALGVAHV